MFKWLLTVGTDGKPDAIINKTSFDPASFWLGFFTATAILILLIVIINLFKK